MDYMLTEQYNRVLDNRKIAEAKIQREDAVDADTPLELQMVNMAQSVEEEHIASQPIRRSHRGVHV